MKEDAVRLNEEYERGLQLLPDLIKAMRIQREKCQDILESRKIIYDEQLNTWEKKVIAHEKNKKKLIRDGKHREVNFSLLLYLIFKTFRYLKKHLSSCEKCVKRRREAIVVLNVFVFL
jgi:hypothetical protein